jgi:CheY-like chemotaxis protein
MDFKKYNSLRDFIDSENAIDAFLASIDQSSILSISDTSANILWVNDNFEKTFKCKHSDVLGKNYKIFSSKIHGPEFYHVMWSTIQAGKSWKGIFCNKDLNDNYIWLQTYIIPKLDENSKVKYYVTVRQDVTYLMEHKASLENKIREELKIKNDFFSRLSHEIKTPLNAILGMVDILEMSELNTEQKDCVDTIFNSSHRLVQMINKTIEFNKVESEEFKLLDISFNLEKILAQIKEHFGVMANQKNLNFKIVNKAAHNHYIADSKRVHQILGYLVENAIKYTNEGDIKITIKEDRSEETLLFEVRDTGIGLKEEIGVSIFNQLLQSEDFNGFGLSLAISKKILDKMQGEIGYKTSEGDGSLFWFKIPVKFEIVSNDTEENTPINLLATELKVLIVEDDSINQRLLKKLLTKFDVFAETASNGYDALALQKEQNYNVIFMDVNMPVMDGITATKKIRANPDIYGHPIIIAVTANSVTGDEEHCMNAGMNDYISKPIKRDELEKIVLGLQGKCKYELNFKPRANSKFYIQKINSDFSGDEEILYDFIRNIISKLPLKLARIEKLISEDNFRQVQFEANSLKDLISCLHHEELRRLMELVENYGREGKKRNINPLVNDIREHVFLLCGELEDYYFKEAA